MTTSFLRTGAHSCPVALSGDVADQTGKIADTNYLRGTLEVRRITKLSARIMRLGAANYKMGALNFIVDIDRANEVREGQQFGIELPRFQLWPNPRCGRTRVRRSRAARNSGTGNPSCYGEEVHEGTSASSGRETFALAARLGHLQDSRNSSVRPASTQPQVRPRAWPPVRPQAVRHRPG
jgi:hypothetical protein